MIGICAYGCSTAAGQGVEALWMGLSQGQSFVRAVPTRSWPVPPTFEPKACLWPETARATAAYDRLLFHLMNSWREAKTSLNPMALKRTGVILATTKGVIEDYIWGETCPDDVLTPVLDGFCQQAEIQTTRRVVLSNACSSSLSALWLAREWLCSQSVDHVIILAADTVGPFTLQGFNCLHALSAQTCRPFSGARDGLQLGEAAAVLVLGHSVGDFVLSGVAIDVEGYAVTRPSPSGKSLQRAVQQMPARPDLIFAHGTGTVLNDAIEDQVFHEEYGTEPLITGSKWSIGHTLGACGAIDTILACESIRRAQVPALGNTSDADPGFHSRYLLKGAQTDHVPQRVLISSLGFGGIHAVALMEKRVSQ